MKVIAKITSIEPGNMHLQIDNLVSREQIQELTLNEMYTFEITKLENARSKQQNKYMWALIHEIAQKYGEANEWNVYINALERANVKYEYLMILPKAEKLLKENFRAIKFIKKREENGTIFHVYKCFYGSSKFDKKEMRNLIDCLIEIAVKVGINTEFYEGVLQ